MEIVKFVQSYLLESDLDMYHDVTKTTAVARSSSLIEELGQVKFIFSDKTGTLTCNEMQFRACSIAGLSYADKVDTDKRDQYDFKQLKKHAKSHANAHVIDEFLTLLATCHTVIPETQEGSSDIAYQASSPDEGALVKGASLLNYVFHVRKNYTYTTHFYSLL